MSGAETLRGLIYQPRYATYRVLAALGQRAIAADAAEPVIEEFSIEGATVSDAPIWDVRLSYSDGMIDFHECKDTRIRAEDRQRFYVRLRREIAAGTPAARIRPVWVTDPDKQSPNALSYLGGIPAAVAGLEFTSVRRVLPSRMDSVQDAVQEAVYTLCHDDDSKGCSRRCTFDEAQVILERLRIAQHRFDDLDTAVKLLATGVFSRGTADAVNEFITGVVVERIVQSGQACFTIDDFLQATRTTALGLDAEGRLRHLLSFSAGSGFRPGVRLVVWSRLPEKPTTRWSLRDRVAGYPPGRSSLLVAGMGVGKTVASQMAFDDEAGRGHPSRVVRLEARSLDRDDLDAAVRLTCLLAGIGPTWLAIDGLDEIPHGLRPDWERMLRALTVLPNLTLLATIRREVLAVREWLADLTQSLERLEMQPLEPRQVEQAFAGVGLPVPSNPQLIWVLQNPFLLSLYADVVAPDDMPLAESGEVTAYRVIDEFWRRRVRGVSVGQRAVGDSESSQEPKRRAALALAERNLAGDLIIARGAPDPDVAAGVEMLVREGVIREQGGGSVAWIHEWLREYAIVDLLLSRSEAATAVALARRLVADCRADHVGRAAAAGGVKWVLSNPRAGSPSDFLCQLWPLNPGFAREALAVCLEGPSSALALGTLPDHVLVEALVLATHLGATQWSGQVAQLPDERFTGNVGDQLHDIAVHYELVLAPAASQPTDAVRRLVARDLLRWRADRPPRRATFRTLLARGIATEAYRDSVVREWLALAAGAVGGLELADVLKGVSAMAGAGDIDGAHAVFCAALGFGERARSDAVTDALTARRSLFGREVGTVLGTTGLIARSPATWGRTAIELLSRLLEARQRQAWPSLLPYMAAAARAAGTPLAEDQAFEVEYDQDPRLSWLGRRDDDDALHGVAAAVDQGFRELASLEDAAAFRALAERAVDSRFAAVIAIPLFVLYDSARGLVREHEWHLAEALRLLSEDAVVGLASLESARRLLRRQLGTRLRRPQQEAVAAAIRRASLPAAARAREFSDLATWGVLTAEDASAVQENSGEAREPTDPRDEELFSAEWMQSPAAEETRMGWPHREDDEAIRLLQQAESEGGDGDDGAERPASLTRRLAALATVLRQGEATSNEWLGDSLNWCYGGIRALRRDVRRQAGGQGPAQQLDCATWKDALDRDAPWWTRMAEAALRRLADAVPTSHEREQVDVESFCWPPSDHVVAALKFLDHLLSVEPGPPLDVFQLRLVETVLSMWTAWPPFTKAAALHCLRPWFWFRFPALRMLLPDLVGKESCELVVTFAVNCCAGMAWTTPVPELADFLRRAASGGYEEALYTVSRLLGGAAVRAALSSAGSRAKALGDQFRGGLALEWPDVGALCGFLNGGLFGATETARHAPAFTSQLAGAWTGVAEAITGRWPFGGEEPSNAERFPVHTLGSVFDMKWPPDVRTVLFQGLTGIFGMLLQRGGLAEYCDLHFQLTELLKSGRRADRGGGAQSDGLSVSEATEAVFVTLCRASVERAAAWSREGKTTDDPGWASGLDGRESANLMKCCLEIIRDRESLKRGLMPLVDVLADAGRTAVAADLRAYLRRT